MMRQPEEHITLSQLQAGIREALTGNFPLPLWIVAEIGEMKINIASGHCYMELVEKGIGENAVPKAKASAVVWRNTFNMLRPYFRQATGQEIAAGMKVLLKVSVSYHELYGLSLQIHDIDPKYTLGEQEQQRLQTIAQLRSDGVFDLNRQLSLPVVIQRIAVISSANAAGYRDFMNELREGGYVFHVELFDAVMQGSGAEESIVGALERVAEREESFDAVVIIRGGGAGSDLSCFNSYTLSSNVAQFPLPVITGIGHDKDQSVVDMVAAVALKTPTAVAGEIVGVAEAFESRLDELNEELHMSALDMLSENARHIDRMGLMLSQRMNRLMRDIDVMFERFENRMQFAARSCILNGDKRLDRYHEQMISTLTGRFRLADQRLDSARQLVDSRRPERIMALGFAIVRHGGHAVTDPKTIAEGEEIEITLQKGELKAKITE